MNTEIDLKKNIYNSIKTWIDTNNISIRSFAKQLNVAYPSAYRWYSGICLPDINLIPKICKIMNVSIQKFLGIDELPETEQNLLYLYENNPCFRNLIDKYLKNDDFKKSIDGLVKITNN